MAGTLSVSTDLTSVRGTKFRPVFSIRQEVTTIISYLTTEQVPEPSEHVPLINCMMGSDFPPDSADVCLEMLDITTTSPEDVRACVETDQGSNLLHDIGVETKNLQPSLTGFPWILFNDVSESFML